MTTSTMLSRKTSTAEDHSWSICPSSQDFVHLYWTISKLFSSKIIFLRTRKWTPMITWVGRLSLIVSHRLLNEKIIKPIVMFWRTAFSINDMTMRDSNYATRHRASRSCAKQTGNREQICEKVFRLKIGLPCKKVQHYSQSRSWHTPSHFWRHLFSSLSLHYLAITEKE